MFRLSIVYQIAAAEHTYFLVPSDGACEFSSKSDILQETSVGENSNRADFCRHQTNRKCETCMYKQGGTISGLFSIDILCQISSTGTLA